MSAVATTRHRPPTPERIAYLEEQRRRHREDAVCAGLVAMLVGMLVGAVVFGIGIAAVYGPIVSHAVATTGITGIVSCTIAGFVIGAVRDYRRARTRFAVLQG